MTSIFLIHFFFLQFYTMLVFSLYVLAEYSSLWDEVFLWPYVETWRRLIFPYRWHTDILGKEDIQIHKHVWLFMYKDSTFSGMSPLDLRLWNTQVFLSIKLSRCITVLFTLWDYMPHLLGYYFYYLYTKICMFDSMVFVISMAFWIQINA